MKRIISLCVVVLFGGITLSAQRQVSVVSSTNESVTLRSLGYGKHAAQALADAELSAVKLLLFYGAAETAFRLPMIAEGESAATEKHRSFFTSFSSTDYKNFVESSVIVTPFGKNEVKQKCITVDVMIRASQLRMYLEQNGIIRKFGL